MVSAYATYPLPWESYPSRWRTWFHSATFMYRSLCCLHQGRWGLRHPSSQLQYHFFDSINCDLFTHFMPFSRLTVIFHFQFSFYWASIQRGLAILWEDIKKVETYSQHSALANTLAFCMKFFPLTYQSQKTSKHKSTLLFVHAFKCPLILSIYQALWLKPVDQFCIDLRTSSPLRTQKNALITLKKHHVECRCSYTKTIGREI